ncbi:hypothetical protein OAU96_02105 [Planctomycetota bacterium]|nr:hypothetical protein [Planctomycetota bacterium]
MIWPAIIFSLLMIPSPLLEEAQLPKDLPAPPMILDSLGEYQREVVTDSEEARLWFDQGYNLMLSFNFNGAIRSFYQATIHDPEFAMAWWGIAYSSGPNINVPMIMPGPFAGWCYSASKKAAEFADQESLPNQAIIAALQNRYDWPMPEDLTELNGAYRDAILAVHEKFPMDSDIATLSVESMMLMQPWKYWSADGEPQGNTLQFKGIIEQVLNREPNHPAACHLYIHIMESSQSPGLAEKAADRLLNLIPGAGHMVHMPSHIWMSTGRYAESADCNRNAVALDDAWFERNGGPTDYYFYSMHNRHFLGYSTLMLGRSHECIEVTSAIAKNAPPQLFQQFASFSDNWAASEYHVLVRFGKWEAILKKPMPEEWRYVSRAVLHYARGVAYANTERFEEARAELKKFNEATKEIPEDFTMGDNPCDEVLAVGRGVLEGEILFKEGSHEEALVKLQQAVELEDQLVYAEPPSWPVPARHPYGALLNTAGQFAEAEKVFLKDLEHYPANGWALIGLTNALEGQGRSDEADLTRRAFQTAWKHADVFPTSACYCGEIGSQ